MEALDWKMILILVQWLIIVIMAFALFRATPPAVVELIFKLLEQQAQTTPDTTDDEAIAVGKAIYEQLKNQASTSNDKSVTTTIATTTPL